MQIPVASTILCRTKKGTPRTNQRQQHHAPGSKPCDEGEEIGVKMRIVLAEARKAKTRTFAGDTTHAVSEPG
jgi:hypothetical protein